MGKPRVTSRSTARLNRRPDSARGKLRGEENLSQRLSNPDTMRHLRNSRSVISRAKSGCGGITTDTVFPGTALRQYLLDGETAAGRHNFTRVQSHWFKKTILLNTMGPILQTQLDLRLARLKAGVEIFLDHTRNGVLDFLDRVGQWMFSWIGDDLALESVGGQGKRRIEMEAARKKQPSSWDRFLEKGLQLAMSVAENGDGGGGWTKPTLTEALMTVLSDATFVARLGFRPAQDAAAIPAHRQVVAEQLADVLLAPIPGRGGRHFSNEYIRGLLQNPDDLGLHLEEQVWARIAPMLIVTPCTSVATIRPKATDAKSDLDIIRWLTLGTSGENLRAGAARPSWQPHLQANQQAILDAAALIDAPNKGHQDPSQRSVIVVLGASYASDVPLETLAKDYFVYLVDLDLKSMQLAISSLPPELQKYVAPQMMDASGGVALQVAGRAKAILEDPSIRSGDESNAQFLAYLDTVEIKPELGIPVDTRQPHLIVSTMLLSQLATIIIGNYTVQFEIKFGQTPTLLTAPKVRAFMGRMIGAHVTALETQVKFGSVVYLASDVATYMRDNQNWQQVAHHDVIYDRQGRAVTDMPSMLSTRLTWKRSWTWQVSALSDALALVGKSLRDIGLSVDLAILWRDVQAVALVPPNKTARREEK